MKTKKRSELVLFDTLELEKKDSKTSHWLGSQGHYVIEKLESFGQRKPVARVYINRVYFTGLFKTKRNTMYSGDIKEFDCKVYLLFIFEAGKLKIFKKNKF